MGNVSTSDIDATVDRYYTSWTTQDRELYRTVWAEGATFADPPTDNETPPTGFAEILAAMDDVWSRATSIAYDRHTTWRCGSSTAVHVTVTMLTKPSGAGSGQLEVPLIHVFRFDQNALIKRLEAFLDLSLARVVNGDAPDWM